MAEGHSTNPTLLCSKCKAEKPLAEFRKRPERKRGYQSRCMVCQAEDAKTPHRRAKANQKTYEFRMRLKQRDYKEYRRREREANLTRYGIGIEGYAEMFAAQDGKCAICGGQPCGNRWTRDAETGEKREQRFSVDHCHKTGKVRALLCGQCNRGIGDFKDNPELMRKAAEYVEKHSH